MIKDYDIIKPNIMRKLIRKVKRKRYAENFAKRYGMQRKEWVIFKRTKPTAEVQEVRKKALARV